MSPMRRGRALAAFALLAMALAACGGRDTGGAGAGGGQVIADPGITDTDIKLGGSYPFSGPVSAAGAVGKGVEAYFRYVNEEKGGIKSADGKTRKVNWNMLDDAYTPARAVENIKRLVEQDKVFAIFNTLGTPNNTAVWDYLNQSEIPHVFVNTGASKFYGDKAHPWTTGGLVPYPIESTVYAEFLKKEKPNAKVAVLYQNDDFGRDYLHGFENAIKGSGISIVARQSAEVTDPTVDSQVVNLASSGADVFFGIALDKQQAQALKKVHETGWTPLYLVTSVSSTLSSLKPAGIEQYRGAVYSSNFYKDPSDPQWRDDAAMKAYKERLAKYCSGCDPNDSKITNGWVDAEMLERAIQAMNAPTRRALMDSVRNLKDLEIPMLLPGIKVTTTPDDPYPFEAMQVMQFQGGGWKLVGNVIDVSGRRG